MPKIHRIEPAEPGLSNDPADEVIAKLEEIYTAGHNVLFMQSFQRQSPRRDVWIVVTDEDENKKERR